MRNSVYTIREAWMVKSKYINLLCFLISIYLTHRITNVEHCLYNIHKYRCSLYRNSSQPR